MVSSQEAVEPVAVLHYMVEGKMRCEICFGLWMMSPTRGEILILTLRSNMERYIQRSHANLL